MVGSSAPPSVGKGISGEVRIALNFARLFCLTTVTLPGNGTSTADAALPINTAAAKTANSAPRCDMVPPLRLARQGPSHAPIQPDHSSRAPFALPERRRGSSYPQMFPDPVWGRVDQTLGQLP